jgi:hypothetical protein
VTVVEQSGPAKPIGQMQVKEPKELAQLPLFLHGLVAHWKVNFSISFESYVFVNSIQAF